MRRRGTALRRRYGHAKERTSIRVLTRSERINDAPGGHASVFEPGDRIEVGGPAANRDYLIAYRIQRMGEGWKQLGPFGIVHKNSVSSGKGKR